MFTVIVHAHVKEKHVDEFIKATIDNASNSAKEAGVFRFDVLQLADDPTHFVLIEGYRDENSPELHRQTPHYNRWKEKVEPMMVEPRIKSTYNILFPSPEGK
jgi:autoinducer 2-degrading protein